MVKRICDSLEIIIDFKLKLCYYCYWYFFINTEVKDFMSKSKKKGKIIKVIVIVALLLAAVGGVFYAKSAGKSTASNITCISGTVKQQDLAKYVNMSGTVAGKNSVSVTGDPTLKVEKLNVSKGDTVMEGAVLVTIG